MSDGIGPLNVTETERRRLETVDALVASGPASLPRLLDMLTDPSWVVRRSVVAALAALGDVAVGPLAEILRTRRDSEARIAAVVDALVASIGAVEPHIVRLIDETSGAVVADAAQVLGRRGHERSVPLLMQLAIHEDDNVAVAAIEALGRVGGRAAVDALISAVFSGRFFRAFPAIDVLGRTGDPRAVAPLAALLQKPEYALEACRSLGRTAERTAVAPLVGLLSSSADATVRVAAVALAELRECYERRYGARTVLEQAIRQSASSSAIARRLGQALQGADPSEQRAISFLLGLVGSEAAVPLLMRLLDSPSTSSVAAEALRTIGERESELVIARALAEGDSARRQALLPTADDPEVADAVVLCLADPDPVVRALACDTLARLEIARVAPPLFRLLGDRNPRVVQAATAAIQSLGSPDTESLALEAARSPNPAIRRAAMRILSYFGYERAFPVLAAALRDADARVRDTAIQGLPFMDAPAALEALLDIARDEDDQSRATAMRALGQTRADSRVTATLLRGLSDAAPWVRYYACQSIGKLAIGEAAEAVAGRLEDEAGQVRVAAVEALSHISSPLALSALERATGSPDPDMKRAALIGLGMTRRPESVPLLIAATNAADAPTRLVALSALADLPFPKVLPALARAVSDQDESVRTAAIGFLASAPGAEASRTLIDFLHDGSSREQILAALATPAEGRVPAIASALDEASDELAASLASVLARLGTREATQALLRALRSSTAAGRKASAGALAAVASRDATSALRKSATEDPDPDVRRVCQLLLAA